MPTLKMPPAIEGIVALLRLLPQISPPKTAAYAVLILFSAVSPLGVAVVTGSLIGAVSDAIGDGLNSAAGRATMLLLGVMAVLIVVQHVSGQLLDAMSTILGRDLERYLQERVMVAVGRPVGIAHLEDSEVLDQLRAVRGLGMDAERPSQAIQGLTQSVPSWLSAIGGAILLCFFQWWLGVLWLIGWPLLLYYMQKEYVRIGQVTYDQSSVLRRAEYLRDLAMTAPPAKEIRVWGMNDWLVQRFDETWLGAMRPTWAARKSDQRILYGTSGAIVALNLLSFGALAWAAIRGDLSLAGLAIFLQALIRVNSYSAFNDANAYLARAALIVPKIIALDDDLAAERRSLGTALVPVDAPRREIRFEAARFRYPHSERDALLKLDLTIAAHQSLAIVGENGAGKTSLVKLLCGLYAPTDGRITIDGSPLSDFDTDSWRGRVAALFQDFARYHLPIRENIGFGAPALATAKMSDSADDMDRLRSAAEKAGILDLIESLPGTWDTILSREYEGGTDLSGGQWQRIALARAMFAVEAGAKVLILDEPTAALDVRAEAELYERFLELTEGLTTILISHRFSTVRKADRIVVLADGAIAEDGSHEQLMELGGRYAEMFTLQAARFQSAQFQTEAASSEVPGQSGGTTRSASPGVRGGRAPAGTVVEAGNA